MAIQEAPLYKTLRNIETESEVESFSSLQNRKPLYPIGNKGLLF